MDRNETFDEAPMVAGFAYRERLARLPDEFPATLVPEPENRYNPRAVAVRTAEGKIGYVAPEVATAWYDMLGAGGAACRVRKEPPERARDTGIAAYVRRLPS
ncbi:MAG TPA: HIRAN domain-containing protein [Vicinamibacterales bacterium]|nr:HIRAN domain-containing protein [Vicinamibacterales bacterium]